MYFNGELDMIKKYESPSATASALFPHGANAQMDRFNCEASCNKLVICRLRFLQWIIST